jgi:hypothetical protein
MAQFHAQPYDIDATGFYFNDAEDYQIKADANRNRYGQPVEEYEIQFIDGTDLECSFVSAAGINQANLGDVIECLETWEDHDLIIACIAFGKLGMAFDPDFDPDRSDIIVHHYDNLEEMADDLIFNEQILGPIPPALEPYIDVEAYVQGTLRHSVSETTIAGTNYIYESC